MAAAESVTILVCSTLVLFYRFDRGRRHRLGPSGAFENGHFVHCVEWDNA